MASFDSITITLLIIAFTVIISYQGFSHYHWIDRWKHYPYRESSTKEWYRLLTSGFVHADWVHLLINMYILFSVGEFIESYIRHWYGDVLGRFIFLGMYLLNIVLANIPTAFKQQDNPSFSSIGASGAISGLLFMVILITPWSMFQLFFIIPVPAVLLGAAYLIYSSWAANHEKGRLDHSAHFAGALAGMAMIILLHHEILNDFFRSLVNDFPWK